MLKVSSHDLDHFKEVWSKFDPDADGRIPATSLVDLVLQLPPPMGVGGEDASKATRAEALRFAMGLEVLAMDGEVLFRDVIEALLHHR